MDAVRELNRHKPGPTLGRIAFADHRRVPFGSAEDYGRAIEELWTLVPDARYWTKTVHALDAHGLVSTLVIEGTDAHGNELQWGRTFLFLSNGRQVEVYEEDGLDAALARFEELRPPAPRLDNAASQVAERALGYFATRDWEAIGQVLADDVAADDRRRTTNAGLRYGRDAEIENWQAAADVGFKNLTSTVVATRGGRLILAHLEASGRDPEAIRGEFLVVIEIDTDERIVAFVVFEHDDFDAAIAELDARYIAGEAAAHAHTWSVVTPALLPENTATRVFERVWNYFGARDGEALTEMVADNIADNVAVDDRRRVVNAGIRHGRNAAIEEMQATVDVGLAVTVVGALATRGERLALIRVRVSGRDPGTIQNDALNIVEIDADDRIVAGVVFDLDDFDAALAELDARYLAGEAAADAGTWSVITGFVAEHNQREIAAVTTDAVSIDHRRGASFAPGEGFEYIRAGWGLGQNLNLYIEIVHQLNDLGAVFTWAGHGTSHEGFDAEWRGVTLMTIDGEMASRMEVFDEEDLDAALAKFDQLIRPTPRLENSATRAWERVFSYIASGNWHAVTQATAENVSVDDRRRVVNAGILHGRDANIKDTQATVGVGFAMTMEGVLATRGERLALIRVRAAGHDPEATRNDALNIVEIDADDRIVGDVVFDLDDFDAAFAELDARYIAGEGAAHAGTWSLIAGAFVALNRHEFPSATKDVVSLDHRRGPAFAPGEGLEYIRAGWDHDQTLNLYIETAHRVNDRGAVFTWTGYGTSHEGFDAEWRGVEIMTVDGDLISRAEVFDEADLDAAVARFEQLSLPALRLKTSVAERIAAHIAARDWDALAQDFAEDYCLDDRRRVVNAGVMQGRDAGVENTRVAAEVGLLTNTTSTIIASRGERLTLERFHASGADHESIQNDALNIVEIDADERIAAVVMFDLDDIDAAFAELDARYLAGEAAAHSQTWSVISQAYAALNRRELPATTTDWVNIDHRRGTSFASGEMPALLNAVWNLTTDLSHSIEAVHRLNDVGAVVANTSHETSQEGFDAEWRVITVATVEGDLLNRCEVFDEEDLDAALARFDELHPQKPRLENAAGRIFARCFACFSARDWAAMAELLVDDIVVDDRRRVVNAGIRRGRDVYIADNQAAVEIGADTISSSVIATRGKRLALARVRSVNRGLLSGEVGAEMLGIVEIDADERIFAGVIFDLEDVDAAFEELEARYLAGEASDYAQTWSVITRTTAAFNRHELPPADWVTIDHRTLAPIDASDLPAAMRAAWDLTPDFSTRIEAVHRLSSFGAVVTYTAYGTSLEGFAAEWRMVDLLTVEGDRISRVEFFDEVDLDAALARFDELERVRPSFGNAATRAWARVADAFNGRDAEALLGLATT